MTEISPSRRLFLDRLSELMGLLDADGGQIVRIGEDVRYVTTREDIEDFLADVLPESETMTCPRLPEDAPILEVVSRP